MRCNNRYEGIEERRRRWTCVVDCRFFLFLSSSSFYFSAFTDSVVYEWWLSAVDGLDDSATEATATATKTTPAPATSATNSRLLQRGQDATFTATASMVGSMLSVRVTPLKGCGERGESSCVACRYPVIDVPAETFKPLLSRVTMLEKSQGKEEDEEKKNTSLRVLTYNVLWGLSQSKSNKSKKKQERDKEDNSRKQNLMLHKCVVTNRAQLPVDIESRHYRQLVLVREILAYNPDVLCMQEVTSAMYEDYIRPLLQLKGGLESCRAIDSENKPGELVVMWRKQRYDLINQSSWKISTLLDEPHNEDILAALQVAPAMATYIRGLSQVAQAVQLQEKNGCRQIFVLNCHLVMEKFAKQLRALQSCLILRQLQVWESYRCSNKNDQSRIVLCGDFNTSGPTSPLAAALVFLKQGSLPGKTTKNEF